MGNYFHFTGVLLAFLNTRQICIMASFQNNLNLNFKKIFCWRGSKKEALFLKWQLNITLNFPLTLFLFLWCDFVNSDYILLAICLAGALITFMFCFYIPAPLTYVSALYPGPPLISPPSVLKGLRPRVSPFPPPPPATSSGIGFFVSGSIWKNEI
jgi:hypothetical protein